MMHALNYLKLFGFLVSFACLIGSVQADDTDIYLGSIPEGSKPNVLFILDNSGSMNNAARDAEGDFTGKSRVDAMKEAFTEIMARTTGVNVGLVRFNAPGAAIEYPVTDIDEVLNSTSTVITPTLPDMLISADDAVENKLTGSVRIDLETLRLGFTSASASGNTVRSHIRHHNDDREERLSDGRRIDNNSHYQLNIDSYQFNAVRFYNMGIPQGANIIEAKLMLRSPRYFGDAIDMEISAQAEKNPVRFTGNRWDLRNRYDDHRSIAQVNWSLTGSEPWSAGERYDSPDLKTIVQELVNAPDWEPDDAMVFFIRKTGGPGQRAGTLHHRRVSSSQGPDGTNTYLQITWGDASVDADNLVGLRFQQVGIPQGATIDSAYINFTTAQAHTGADGLVLKVKAEDTSDAAPFTAAANALSARSKLVGSDPDWTPESELDVATELPGPEVTSLVQQVVNRSDWCGNNAMAFFIEPTATSLVGDRAVFALDDESRRHAELVVSYTEGVSPGCMNPVWSKAVSSGEDDAEQDTRARVTNSGNTLDIQDEQWVGIRIDQVPIEPDARVMEAYLELTAKGSISGSGYFDVFAHDTNDSAAFLNRRRDISNRSLTSSTVRWTPVDWTDQLTYRSPDISAVLQEVFDRSGWRAGNAISLILQSSRSGGRDAYSYDSSVARAPRLVIKIASGGLDSGEQTVRSHLTQIVNNIEARNWTPIVDALYESALYLRGDEVYYGLERSSGGIDRRYKRVSHADSYSGGTHTFPPGCSADNLNDSDCRYERINNSPSTAVYDSPIVNDCQGTHVVLLTDGEANYNHSVDEIKALTGDTSCASDSPHSGEQCARTLVRWMAENDMRPSLSPHVTTITTHTIAFNLSEDRPVTFLSDLAAAGGGSFHTANTADELADAFDTILADVISRNTTLTSPSATVNQFNRLNHRNEVFFSLFRPVTEPRWFGNLKRYRIAGDPPVIVDQNNREAVNVDTGFFKSTAQSFWSDTVDGDDIALGGAAYALPDNPDDRKVLTYLSSAPGATKLLTAPVNALHEDNSNITAGMLSAVDASQRTNILRWARGVDVNDFDGDLDVAEARTQLGDPLHSTPDVVTYGGSDTSPDMTIFFGTNEGAFHAVNGTTGEEHFAFLPQATMGILKTLYLNTDLFTHPYGIDGSPVSWVNDANGDNKISVGTDHVYVYFGMRRGGNQYFGLDVTDRDNPSMLWQIEGGSGDFANLGQTWSTPVKAKVQIGTDIKDVLIFGGGFDENLDLSPNNRITNHVGNALYIVDALTGQRLWWASSSYAGGDGMRDAQMVYAIAAEPAVVDINFDGLVDQIYFGDLGGQVWRFDIHNGNAASALATGGVIADLGGDSGANFRRFFFTPDVGYVDRAGQKALAIALGSGAVNEPLDTITTDRFYVLFQTDVFTASESYTVVTESDLSNITGSSDEVAYQGWYLDLDHAGEKSLAAPVIVNNRVLFTTYQPSVAGGSACSATLGLGRFYALKVGNGAASDDLDLSGVIDDDDRSQDLKGGSIPPSPKVLFPEESDDPMVLIGPETVPNLDLGVSVDWEKVYWYED